MRARGGLVEGFLELVDCVEFRRRATRLRRIPESMCQRVWSGRQKPVLRGDTPTVGRRREYQGLEFLDRFFLMESHVSAILTYDITTKSTKSRERDTYENW